MDAVLSEMKAELKGLLEKLSGLREEVRPSSPPQRKVIVNLGVDVDRVSDSAKTFNANKFWAFSKSPAP